MFIYYRCQSITVHKHIAAKLITQHILHCNTQHILHCVTQHILNCITQYI